MEASKLRKETAATTLRYTHGTAAMGIAFFYP
jgi:hypothetical protein